MKQFLLIVMAVVLVAGASLGCGSSGDSDRADSATPAPASKADTSASPAPAAKADAPATKPGQILGVPGQILGVPGLPGLPAGWELAPRTKITGRQASGVVTITASGENPTGGYENQLFESPLRIWPPQFILARKKPDGPATQAITPYQATASFKADRKVATVVVNDASGRSVVSVAQAQH